MKNIFAPALLAFALLSFAPCAAEDTPAADQAEAANTNSSLGDVALTDERASSHAGQTFDNSSPTATTEGGEGLQPQPFSATPNE